MNTDRQGIRLKGGLPKSVKLLIGIAILVLLFVQVPISDVINVLSELKLDSIILLMLISVVLVYVSALKWGLFLASFGHRVSAFYLFCLYLIGYFINLIIPSYVGGDAIRSWYIGRKSSQHDALASTILERYTGIVMMLILALASMWWVRLVPLKVKLVVILSAAAITTITIISLSATFISLLEKIPAANRFAPHFVKLQNAIKLAQNSPGLLVKALALSFIYHLFTIANTVSAAWAVGWWNPPVAELFVVVPVILIVGAIPLSPGGLGLQEGAFFYFLRGLGASDAQALGIGFILRAKVYLLALLGGMVWWVHKSPTQDAEKGK